MAKADEPDPALVESIVDRIMVEGWGDLVPALKAVLTTMSESGVSVGFDQIGAEPDDAITAQANQDAIDYASQRAAELVGMRVQEDGTLVVNPNAEWAITDTTRDALRSIVTQALQEGMGTVELAQHMAESYAFSEARATMIARTEMAMADVAGNMAAYRRSGVVRGKEWVLGSEHEEMDECDDAAGMGVVPLDSDFGGIGDPPAHPNCACDVLPVLDE